MKFRKPWQTKADLITAGPIDLSDYSTWMEWVGNTSIAGQRITPEKLLDVTATWSCIRLISETIGTLPIHLYRKTDGGRERVTDHYISRLLKQPHRFVNGVEWRESMAVSLCVWGQSYCEVQRLGSRVTSLLPVAKSVVTAKIVDGEPAFFITKDGKQKKYNWIDLNSRQDSELLPIKGFGGAGQIEGYPVWRHASPAVALAAAAESFGSNFFADGGKMTGFLTYDKFLTPAQRVDAADMFQKLKENTSSAMRTGIVEGGMSYTPVSSKNNEAQFIEARKNQIAEIARIWRVPLSKLMEMDRATYANSEQANIEFLNDTLRPYLVRIEAQLNNSLLDNKDKRDHYIEFDVKGLLRGDSKARSEYYRNMRMIGGMTINEVRERENLPKIEGGDDVHVPLNMAPSDQLREILGDDDE